MRRYPSRMLWSSSTSSIFSAIVSLQDPFWEYRPAKGLALRLGMPDTRTEASSATIRPWLFPGCSCRLRRWLRLRKGAPNLQLRGESHAIQVVEVEFAIMIERVRIGGAENRVGGMNRGERGKSSI